MFRRAYDWMMKEAGGPRALAALAAVSFAESSFFPLPPDVMLVPMCLAERRKAFFFALVCSIASVLGGMLGYGIGYFLYEAVGKPILNLYGGADAAYARLAAFFQQYGALVIIIKGLTPLPFKLLTIFSGAVKFNFIVFVLSSLVARGGRFFLVAGLIYAYGERMRGFLEKNLDRVLWGFLLLIIAGVALTALVLH